MENLAEERRRLEEWQAKLTSVSRVWHAERDRREDDLAARGRAVASREAALQETLDRWENIREGERQRLHEELQQWGENRARMGKAAEELQQHSQEMLGQVAVHAARAMASEDLLAETAGKGAGTTRRFNVLRKRWERVFAKKLAAIDAGRIAAADELAHVNDRRDEIHRMLLELGERESKLNDHEARLQIAGPMPVTARVESLRLADVEEELPWAAEELEAQEEPVILANPFREIGRAA
jgi:hypothetical protein